jgi:glycosyltransferase involved in cell wall biosynthesis
MMLAGLRILWCHNRYRTTGGEDVSSRSEVELLRRAGAEVDVYEVSNDTIPDRPGLKEGLTTVWSQCAYREVLQRLEAGRHNLVHVQNFFPLLSPAVFWAARQAGVPTVASLRNFRLTCVNGLLFRNGHICEDCLGRTPLRGVWHRCYRRSAGASAATAVMLMAHRLLGTWKQAVDVFVTPSAFARDRLIAAGLDAGRIYVKPNFVDPDPGPGTGEGGFVLYAGRLSPEKGIETLIDAWRLIGEGPKLVVVGEGPLKDHVQKVCEKARNVEYLGATDFKGVLHLMSQAALVVVPSAWYETFGRVVAEAFAVGTPVVASAIGPLAEMVVPGETGALVPPRDPVALATAVKELLHDQIRLARMRRQARAVYEACYTAERNAADFERIYQAAVEGHRG